MNFLQILCVFALVLQIEGVKKAVEVPKKEVKVHTVEVVVTEPTELVQTFYTKGVYVDKMANPLGPPLRLTLERTSKDKDFKGYINVDSNLFFNLDAKYKVTVITDNNREFDQDCLDRADGPVDNPNFYTPGSETH